MKKILVAFLLATLTFSTLSCNKENTGAELVIVGKSEYSLSEVAININVKLSGPEDWTYSLGEASSWIKETSRGAMSVSLFVSSNEETNPRKAVIVFKSASSSATLTIEQKGKDKVPFISISPSGNVNVNADAQQVVLEVSTNMSGWEFSVHDADWLSLSKKSDTQLAIDISDNPVEENRRAYITLYAPSIAENLSNVNFEVVQEAKDIHYDPETLSDAGTSNCYLICHKGQYSFKATVRGNGVAVPGVSIGASLSPSSAQLLWQSSPDMIESVSLDGNMVTFVARRVFGNALIGVSDKSGKILWSWHIWFPKEDVRAVSTYTGEQVMCYNIGAVDSNPGALSSYGLLFQWGRKDPFPGASKASNGDVSMKNVPVYDINGVEVPILNVQALSSDITQTGMTHIEYAVAHPTVCIGNRDQYYYGCRSWVAGDQLNASLWGNPEGNVRKEGKYVNKGSKNFFDPCPVGWRVPDICVFQPLTPTGGMVWATGTTDNLIWGDIGGASSAQVADIDGDGKLSLNGDWKNGWHFYMNQYDKNSICYFPATTRYDGQYAMLMGSMVGIWGNYWTNSPDQNGCAQAMAFGLKDYNSDNYSITLSPLATGSQADAYSVRCIKE